MSPSWWVRGRRSVPSATEFIAQLVGMLTVVVRRHLPICTVTGTSAPVGTPCSVNAPVSSVVVAVTYWPIETSQAVQLFVPGVMAGSVATSSGMKTTTL